MNDVGIGHHLQYSHLTVMDQQGQVLRSGRLGNIQVEIEKFLEGLEERDGSSHRNGPPSYAMVDVLEKKGIAVKH